MFYRLILNQGISLINMRQVREVALRGPVVAIFYPPLTDGRGWLGRGKQNPQEIYTFNSESAASAEFEKIQAFLIVSKDATTNNELK
jgi:hypothetical protein